MPALRKPKNLNVNLLPKDAFTQSSIGRVLTWSLSTGRYIVVFTELIVILTFLSRFTLDRQLTDLNESILRKQALLESFGDLETRVRAIQAKTDFIRQLESRVQVLDLFDSLTAQAPESIVFDKLAVRSDSFTFEATAFSSSSLTQFINSIKSDPRFSDVILDRINTAENDTGITFVLRANFNEAQTPQ